VEALWGVGPVTARKLHAVGITRLVQVRDVDRATLAAAVGSLADWLLRLAHGDDPRPVVPERESKSVSAETTYAEDLRDLAAMQAEIARLAARVGGALARKRLLARTVTLKVRYADFVTVTRSHTDDGVTADPANIAVRASALLRRTEAVRRPVRLLGVGTHGLVAGSPSGPNPAGPSLCWWAADVGRGGPAAPA
jgi:DNA polymerase-4